MRLRWLISISFGLAIAGVGGAWYYDRYQEQSRIASASQSFQRALTLLNSSDPEEFLKVLGDLQNVPGFEKHCQVLEAGFLAKSGKPDRALVLLDQTGVDGDYRVPSMTIAAQCLIAQGKFSEAERVLRVILTEQPDSPEIHLQLAKVYQHLGALEFTLGELNRLIELEPNDYRHYWWFGRIKQSEHADQKSAGNYFQKALDQNPPKDHRQAIIRQYVECLFENREYEKCLELLEELPPDVNTLCLKAESLWTTGQKEQAQSTLSQAKALAPDALPVLITQAKLDLDSGRGENAVAVLREVVKRRPKEHNLRYQLAMALRSQGQPDEAAREAAAAEEIRTFREKLQDLKQIASRDIENAEIRDQIADMCEKFGEKELAQLWRQLARDCREFGKKNLAK